MWAVRAVLIAIVIIAVVSFAYFNINPDQTVDVDLVWVKYIEVPLITVVFWAFIGGVVVSLLLFISVYIKHSFQLRMSHKRISALENEVTVLRNRPIEESAAIIKAGETNAGKPSTFRNSE